FLDPGFGAAAKGRRGKTETSGRKARFGSRARDAVAGTTKTELCQREIASARFGNRKTQKTNPEQIDSENPTSRLPKKHRHAALDRVGLVFSPQPFWEFILIA